MGRIAAACWMNVLQKRAINDTSKLGTRPTALEMLLAILTIMTMALAPWWAWAIYESWALLNQPEQGTAPKALAFWGWLTIACTLEVPGNFLLLRSIQRTDLSIFGPLSSYKPIVGMLLGWWILAEVPTLFGVLGMGIVLGGSLLLADPTRTSNGAGSSHVNFWNSGVVDRLLAVALTAAGSIFLKLSMKSQDALTSLAAWSFVSWLLALAWLLVELGRASIPVPLNVVSSRPPTFQRPD